MQRSDQDKAQTKDGKEDHRHIRCDKCGKEHVSGKETIYCLIPQATKDLDADWYLIFPATCLWRCRDCFVKFGTQL